MSWRETLANAIMPKVKQAEGEVVAAVQKKTGLSARAALCLLVLTSLFTFAAAYGVYWRYLRPEKGPSAGLAPVQTQGGQTVGQSHQAPAIEAAAKKGKAKPRIETRPVATIPAADLPPEESAMVPAVAPAAGPDNVVRKPELADTAVVPPSRGSTITRTYLMPSGSFMTTQDAESMREPFLGLPWRDGNWKRVEIEAGYGIGGKQVDLQASWWPLRVGNVHLGARGETWMEQGGTMKAAGSLRIRWEPFREQYR